MKNPVFSIITVTYQAVEVLEKTIRSIAGQSWKGIEYIIIDGGSTDGTTDLIARYKDDIQYWVSEPDEGIYYAMNKGLAKATGEYVWFINAGDELAGGTVIETMVRQVEKLDALPDILYGQTKIIDRTGRVVGDRRLKAPEGLTWKSFRWGMLVCHQSFVVKRELVPLYDIHYRYSADYKWCIESLQRARVIFNTHMYLSYFMEEGTTSQYRKASLKERYDIMCRYYGRVKTNLYHLWFAVRFYTAPWMGKKR